MAKKVFDSVDLVRHIYSYGPERLLLKLDALKRTTRIAFHNMENDKYFK